MIIYGDNTTNRFHHYVREGYRYTYALVDYITGEVRTMACDHQFAPIKALYGYLDGLRRECEGKGDKCHLVLANCRTGEVVEEIHCDYGLLQQATQRG